MGLAALFVGVVIALAIVAAVIYGIVVGLARFGRFMWRTLVAPEGVAEKASVMPCWDEKSCPPSVREACPAYSQGDSLPCWLSNLRTEGRLRISCLTCPRFDMAALVS